MYECLCVGMFVRRSSQRFVSVLFRQRGRLTAGQLQPLLTVGYGQNRRVRTSQHLSECTRESESTRNDGSPFLSQNVCRYAHPMSVRPSIHPSVMTTTAKPLARESHYFI